MGASDWRAGDTPDFQNRRSEAVRHYWAGYASDDLALPQTTWLRQTSAIKSAKLQIQPMHGGGGRGSLTWAY